MIAIISATEISKIITKVIEMRLEQYVEEVGISPPKLAKKAGVSPLTIRNVMNHKQGIQLITAIKIEDATKGQVTCREMLPQVQSLVKTLKPFPVPLQDLSPKKSPKRNDDKKKKNK